jgi:hypothetical protein
LGCSRCGSSNIAQPGVEQAGQTDEARDPGTVLEGLDRDLALPRADDAWEQRLQSLGQRLVGPLEHCRHLADHEEAERQDREEGEEREVGDGARLQVALDQAVVLGGPHHVVHERTAPPQLVEPLLGSGHQDSPPRG